MPPCTTICHRMSLWWPSMWHRLLACMHTLYCLRCKAFLNLLSIPLGSIRIRLFHWLMTAVHEDQQKAGNLDNRLSHCTDLYVCTNCMVISSSWASDKSGYAVELSSPNCSIRLLMVQSDTFIICAMSAIEKWCSRSIASCSSGMSIAGRPLLCLSFLCSTSSCTPARTSLKAVTKSSLYEQESSSSL